ncbi:GNAT family N-acetyltransferase [Ferrimicrobium sp.]|jgi:GNAT superfamily N-acetyltransferase|uniref:GNAT family N-acetyltransferase n=1 Tax=Ferrimicrobium sp. TaxID=2926050 RepID=UPI00261149E7|nr:GNAT family N-acetyltransferase [Ferrimicrobium sp.]
MVTNMINTSSTHPLERWQLLEQHLQQFLGLWPPSGWLQVHPSPRRRRPGWDGSVRQIVGLISPDDGALLSIDPALAHYFSDPKPKINTSVSVDKGGPSVPPVPHDNQTNTATPEMLIDFIHDQLEIEADHCFTALFRFAFNVPDLGRPGTWVPSDTPDIPAWLHPFGGKVLVAYDKGGRVIAGVGLKRHDRYARELAVVTEPATRGRGLAKALVAQAAEQVLSAGMIPTYLHAPKNLASARVAEATGFIDRGWRLVGLTQDAQPRIRALCSSTTPPTSGLGSTPRHG